MARSASSLPSNPFTFSSAFPKDFQLVDAAGQLMPAWQYFLQAIWDKTGGGTTTVNNSYVVIETPSGPVISGPGPSNGTPIGGTVVPKSAPVIQSLSSAPWFFHAAENGFMTLSGGSVQYSRDGVSYYQTSMTGGQIMVLKGDSISVTWYGTDAPVAVWWPGGF